MGTEPGGSDRRCAGICGGVVQLETAVLGYSTPMDYEKTLNKVHGRRLIFIALLLNISRLLKPGRSPWFARFAVWIFRQQLLVHGLICSGLQSGHKIRIIFRGDSIVETPSPHSGNAIHACRIGWRWLIVSSPRSSNIVHAEFESGSCYCPQPCILPLSIGLCLWCFEITLRFAPFKATQTCAG